MSDIYNFDSSRFAQQVGVLLRNIRKQRNLTLEELAKTTEVSKLTLGKIERGEANPTLSVIWKIANSLSIPISSLLAVESEVKVSRNGGGISIHSHDQNCVLEPMFNSAQFGSLEIHRATLKPNSEYHPGAHQLGVMEYVTVMSGELTIQIADQFYHLNEYDSLQFHADNEHTYINPTPNPTIIHFVMIYPNSTSQSNMWK